MANKLWRVVRACVELGPNNPLQQIHDQGAGGNCNVVKEIIYPLGAEIDIRQAQSRCSFYMLQLSKAWTSTLLFIFIFLGIIPAFMLSASSTVVAENCVNLSKKFAFRKAQGLQLAADNADGVHKICFDSAFCHSLWH